MKIISLIALLVLANTTLKTQPEKIENDVTTATVHFTIDSTLSFEGHAFFDSIFKENHYVVLGEYHGSSEIGELTKALIPIYSQQGGNIMGLEIGPFSSEILSSGLQSSNANKFLRSINTKYQLKSDNRAYTPIPFFSNIEDAAFLQTAKDHKLSIIGLDQEYIYSYRMLIDLLSEQVMDSGQLVYADLVERVRDTLIAYEQADMDFKNGSKIKTDRLPIKVHESYFINESLDQLAQLNEKTNEIAASIKSSNEIYYRNATGDWWNSNRLRTENFIRNFRGFVMEADQISGEKLFLKIGGLHAAKGINNYNRYDVGNIIYETARLTDRESCHIVILDRFWLNQEGDIEDVLQDTSSWYGTNFRQLLEVGKPDKWSAIDINRIRKQGLYRKGVNARVREYFERYDIVIIPPADQEPMLNIE